VEVQKKLVGRGGSNQKRGLAIEGGKRKGRKKKKKKADVNRGLLPRKGKEAIQRPKNKKNPISPQ